MEGRLREEVWNIRSGHEGVNSECEREDGNCEGAGSEPDDRNGELTLVKLNKGSQLKGGR
jgi:hypothetical protein